MGLSWKKDGVAPLLIAGLAAIAWAPHSGWDWPVVASLRVIALVAFVVGIAICVIGGDGSYDPKVKRVGAWWRIFLFHGALAFLLMVAALIWPKSIIVVPLLALIGVMWLAVTIKHAFVKPAAKAAPKTAK